MTKDPGQSKPRKTRRFVVLLHSWKGGDHYDLMIDDGGRLATFKSIHPPESAGNDGLECTRIGEHRRIYLDYEGPVSEDRGFVRRHDAGTCILEARSESQWRVTFQGRRLRGSFRLDRLDQSAEAWRLEALSE